MRPTVAKLRARARTESVRLLNLVRRYSIASTSAVLWTLEGLVDDEGNVETRKAEVFSGVGFFSRPKTGSRAEVIAGRVGSEAGHPVILATRDQDAVRALEAGGSLAEDESAVFNTVARLYVKADGTIEARTHAGAAVALMTKPDGDALRTWLLAHVHTHTTPGGATDLSGPPSVTTPTGGAPVAAGTQKLRGE